MHQFGDSDPGPRTAQADSRRETGEQRWPSPCISVCRIDEATGLCAGCDRTLDEIARWGSMTESQKGAVWRSIDARRAHRSID